MLNANKKTHMKTKEKFEALKAAIASANENDANVETIFIETDELISERLDVVTDKDETLVAEVKDFALSNVCDCCDLSTLQAYYAVSDTLETFIDLLASSYIADQTIVLFSKASTIKKLFAKVCAS